MCLLPPAQAFAGPHSQAQPRGTEVEMTAPPLQSPESQLLKAWDWSWACLLCSAAVRMVTPVVMVEKRIETSLET